MLATHGDCYHIFTECAFTKYAFIAEMAIICVRARYILCHDICHVCIEQAGAREYRRGYLWFPSPQVLRVS